MVPYMLLFVVAAGQLLRRSEHVEQALGNPSDDLSDATTEVVRCFLNGVSSESMRMGRFCEDRGDAISS